MSPPSQGNEPKHPRKAKPRRTHTPTDRSRIDHQQRSVSVASDGARGGSGNRMTVAPRGAGGDRAPEVKRSHVHFFGEAFFFVAFFAFLVAFGFLAAFLVLFLAAFGMVSEVFKPKKLGSMSGGGDFRSTGQKMSNLSGIVGVVGAQH